MIQIIRVGIVILNILYSIIKIFPTKEKITMISRQSNNEPVEMKMIKDGIMKRNKNIDVVILCKTLEGREKSSLMSQIKYGFHMFVQMYHIATSKVVILDSYCIAVSVLKHKKDLCVIQMWHSMGTMKKFGYTTLGTEEGSKKELAEAMKMHENYKYVFASSPAYRDHLAAGFNCDQEKVVTMPLPRLDLLQNEEYGKNIRKKVYDKYPVLEKKPVILYCPTFRKEEEDFKFALDKLVEAVDTSKYNLVVKLHPLSKAETADNVIVAREFSSFDILFVADYVISDYSCIVYEAAVLDIPLYFYNFDMDMYEVGRGLAIDYEKELPGVISKDAYEITEAIENQPYNIEELRKFREKYIVPTENATENIIDFVFKCMET